MVMLEQELLYRRQQNVAVSVSVLPDIKPRFWVFRVRKSSLENERSEDFMSFEIPLIRGETLDLYLKRAISVRSE